MNNKWLPLLAIFIASSASTASAVVFVNSGYVFWGSGTLPSPGGAVDAYLLASTSDLWQSHGGEIKVNEAGGGPVKRLPAGWMGVVVQGFRDGAYCGDTGWVFSSWESYNLSVSANLCANPAGSQSFSSAVGGALWVGNGYATAGMQFSPSLNM